MAEAVTYQRYGGPEVLTVAQVNPPSPGRDQIRVAVKAVGVNPMDIKLRHGDLQEQMPAHFPVTPGSDLAGVVDELGADVSGVELGDEVVGLAEGGAYAQYALLGHSFPKPAGLSWTEAAAFPTAAATASRVLGQLSVAPGETLLIHGAGGSVGALAAQLAGAQGVRVVGTCSQADVDYVTGLGVVAVVRGDGWPDRMRAAGIYAVDAVFDTAGAGLLPDSVAVAGGTERVITITDNAAAQAGVRFSAGGPDDVVTQGLFDLLGRAADGELSVRVWRTFPLTEAVAAQQAIEQHRARGKVVLIP